MNKVILTGRLTRDPEVRYTAGESGTAVARYTLAVDRRYQRGGGDSQADFISCVAFGKGAEFAEKYLKKASLIGVIGRIQTGSYTNRDGQRVYTTDVIVDEHEFVAPKSSSQGNSEQPATAAPAAAPAQAATPGDGFMNIPDGIDEDLPFN